MKVVKRINQILLIVAVLAILAWGVFSLAKSSVDICIEENRTAEKVLPFTTESYASGEYQDSLELALGDQLPYAAEVKREYNSFFERFSSPFISRLLGANPEGITYVKINNVVSMIDDYLVYPLDSLEKFKDSVDASVANMNKVIEAHPEIEVYTLYIEKDNDIDFSTGSKSGISAYISEIINLPNNHIGVFSVKDLQQYKSDFFKTDHHWNSFGAHKAYMQLISMMLPSEKLMNPVAITPVGSMQGSKSISAGLSQKEDVSVYEYDFPQNISYSAVKINPNDLNHFDGYVKRTHILDGSVSASAVELASLYAIGIPSASAIEDMIVVSYGDLFGADYGEYVWTNPDCENGNILVLGDSFDNAILRLLSCHFEKLYAVDVRNYSMQLGTEFDLDSYIAHKNIKYILYIGSESFWYSAV